MCKVNPIYLAGLFDGEGFISIRPQSKNRKLSSVNIQVGIGITHNCVKDYHKIFGGCLKIDPETNKHKKVYRWTICKKSDIKRFLEYIYPNLIIKRKQAKVMLDFINIKTVSGRERTKTEDKITKKYINKIRLLNGRVKRKDLFKRG